jgi:hypothetical protein
MSSQADPLRTAPEQEGHPINQAAQAPAGDAPSHVGRYRIERVLGEAGCTDPQLRGHLRGADPPVRGCFVVDRILGQE